MAGIEQFTGEIEQHSRPRSAIIPDDILGIVATGVPLIIEEVTGICGECTSAVSFSAARVARLVFNKDVDLSPHEYSELVRALDQDPRLTPASRGRNKRRDRFRLNPDAAQL